MASKDQVESDDKKVMDVASPGDAKPETGSKPMVVGHKFLSTDPAVKTDQDTSDDSSKEETEKEVQSPAKKIVLAPISDNLKKEEPEQSTDTEKTDDNEQEKKAEVKPSEEESDAVEEKPEEKKTVEEIANEEDQAKIEQEKKLEEIVRSKKYYVPIKVQSASEVQTFLVTFIVVLIVGALLMVGLMDAEIIDLGVDLPFDFL